MMNTGPLIDRCSVRVSAEQEEGRRALRNTAADLQIETRQWPKSDWQRDFTTSLHET
jgi:hypothetical protein